MLVLWNKYKDTGHTIHSVYEYFILIILKDTVSNIHSVYVYQYYNLKIFD